MYKSSRIFKLDRIKKSFKNAEKNDIIPIVESLG